MEIEKRDYLVTGTPNDKTKEKIRLKLRLLLNSHKKCILGLTSIKDIPRLAYEFELLGYKYLFFIYKSTSEKKIIIYEQHFQNVYFHELRTDFGLELKNEKRAADDDSPFILYLFGKSRKRVF